MKVRCIRLLDTSGKPQDKSAWLTIGKIYHVLSVELGSDQKWKLRLVGDGFNGVALFHLEEFEIVTSKIPNSWVMAWGKDGFFELTPETWREPGFWERYYNREPNTVRIFEDERRRTIDADA